MTLSGEVTGIGAMPHIKHNNIYIFVTQQQARNDKSAPMEA